MNPARLGVVFLLALAVAACADRDCSSSDEPICYKEKCDATADKEACATWIEYCRNNPDYEGCEG
ncbi:MAG: hypothetical protein HXY23_10185 [Parvularculaceae bacterium]|nr:hypothetical protein [Parvularculaceae bacterium]